MRLKVLVVVFALSTLLALLAVVKSPSSGNDTLAQRDEDRDLLGQGGQRGGSHEEYARIARAYRVSGDFSELSREEVMQALAQSDHIVQGLQDEGVEDIGAELVRRLESADVDEREIEGYYLENREVFGSRSLAQSRDVVERLVRIEKVRKELLSITEVPPE